MQRMWTFELLNTLTNKVEQIDRMGNINEYGKNGYIELRTRFLEENKEYLPLSRKYTFINNETKELEYAEFPYYMGEMDKKQIEQFLKNNPNLSEYIEAPGLMYNNAKTSNNFREVLHNMHKNTPGSRLNETKAYNL